MCEFFPINVQFIRFRRQVVSGGADGVVEVWNFKPQIRPFKFSGHKGPVNDVHFTKDASRVISCGEDREICFWKNSV
jgi:centriolar protein POC1